MEVSADVDVAMLLRWNRRMQRSLRHQLDTVHQLQARVDQQLERLDPSQRPSKQRSSTTMLRAPAQDFNEAHRVPPRTFLSPLFPMGDASTLHRQDLAYAQNPHAQACSRNEKERAFRQYVALRRQTTHPSILDGDGADGKWLELVVEPRLESIAIRREFERLSDELRSISTGGDGGAAHDDSTRKARQRALIQALRKLQQEPLTAQQVEEIVLGKFQPEDWEEVAQSTWHDARECRFFYEQKRRRTLDRVPWSESERRAMLEFLRQQQSASSQPTSADWKTAIGTWMDDRVLEDTPQRAPWEYFALYKELEKSASAATTAATSGRATVAREPMTQVEEQQEQSDGEPGYSRTWKPADDEQLYQLYAIHGPKWSEIASRMSKSFTAKQVMNRYRRTLQPTVRSGRWTAEEDQKLLRAVQLHEQAHGVDVPVSWSEVAALVPGRTDVKCRERYTCHLDPALQKRPFTAAEDDKLLELVAQHQATPDQKDKPIPWASLCEHFPTRHRTELKARHIFLVRQRKPRKASSKKGQVLDDAKSAVGSPLVDPTSDE